MSFYRLSGLCGLLLFLFACGSSSGPAEPPAASPRTARVEALAREYFATFAERRDWEKLLSFYRYDMVFEDVMLQIKVFNKEDFKGFYNWPEGDFRPVPPDQPHLVLQHLVANDSIAVGRGYFNPFYYNGELQRWRWGSEFTIWLFFDEQLKIKRQIDLIEYPDDILEEVIGRFRQR